MDNEELATAVAEMAQRRVASLRRKAGEAIALRLLAKNGSVTSDEVEEVLAEEFHEPTPQQLADIVAAKLKASFEVHQRELEFASGAMGRAEARLEKARQKVSWAEERLQAAEQSEDPQLAQQRLEDAQQMYEYVTAQGADPSRAPATDEMSAKAGVAQASAQANGGGENQ